MLAGCGVDDAGDGPSGGVPDVPVAAISQVQRYVALGDSYTAAPFVPLTDVAGGCLRSDRNYPALVAEALDADLVDVSCSGAETADVTESQIEGVAPQQDALGRDVDLVTVGLGGNDGDLFSQLVSRCGRQPAGRADGRTGGAAPDPSECVEPLTDRDVDALLGTLEQTRASLSATLELVGERAPQARVIAVGYPTIVAAERRCEALPLDPRDQANAARLNEALNRAVREAAEQAGAEYVDVAAATADHDICAEVPWINGAVTDQRRALAYHPFAEEQRAVADLLVATLSD